MHTRKVLLFCLTLVLLVLPRVVEARLLLGA
jgi:hypothetical protein